MRKLKRKHWMMWQRKLGRLLLFTKGILGKCRVDWQRKLIRFSLLPAGITIFLVISLVVPVSYTPDTSVPFPYIPPPEGEVGYYIASSVEGLTASFRSRYVPPFDEFGNIGLSFILKDVLITDKGLTTREVVFYDQGEEIIILETETYFMSSFIQLFPRNLSEWQELKVGKVVDIVGIYTGVSEEYRTVLVFRNCDFFPRGVAPLPLSGSPAPITGNY
ncbi:hypothetical protein ACFLYS_02700 [Chloroflexota bacterium]